jgi:hypothetical protein
VSSEQRAERREQRGEMREQSAESREQGTGSREQRAESRQQRAEQRAETRESREQMAETREQRQKSESRELATMVNAGCSAMCCLCKHGESGGRGMAVIQERRSRCKQAIAGGIELVSTVRLQIHNSFGIQVCIDSAVRC